MEAVKSFQTYSVMQVNGAQLVQWDHYQITDQPVDRLR